MADMNDKLNAAANKIINAPIPGAAFPNHYTADSRPDYSHIQKNK